MLMWTDGLALTEDQLPPLNFATSEIECVEQIVMSHGDPHDDAAFLMVRKVR